MPGTRTEYSALVDERDRIFPNFQQLQQKSAVDLYESLRGYFEHGEISYVVDIGCGTGEILVLLAQQIERSGLQFENPINLVGYDVNQKSINVANHLVRGRAQRNVTLSFYRVPADAIVLDEFETLLRRRNEAFLYDRVAIICTGHTFFHFHYLVDLFAVLRADAGRRPRFWVIDVYHSLGEILGRLRAGEHLERKAERDNKGNKVSYFLYTTRSPIRKDRLERGLYEVAEGTGRRRTIISTSQLDWSKDDLVVNFVSAHYSLSMQREVETGYGKMDRLYFVLNSDAI